MKTKTLIELIEFMEMYEKEIEKIILDYDGSKSKFDSLEELEKIKDYKIVFASQDEEEKNTLNVQIERI